MLEGEGAVKVLHGDLTVVGPDLVRADTTPLRERWRVVDAACQVYTIHLDPWRAVPLAFMGAVLGFIAWQARSVWPAVFAHALVNGFAYVVALATP